MQKCTKFSLTSSPFALDSHFTSTVASSFNCCEYKNEENEATTKLRDASATNNVTESVREQQQKNGAHKNKKWWRNFVVSFRPELLEIKFYVSFRSTPRPISAGIKSRLKRCHWTEEWIVFFLFLFHFQWTREKKKFFVFSFSLMTVVVERTSFAQWEL